MHLRPDFIVASAKRTHLAGRLGKQLTGVTRAGVSVKKRGYSVSVECVPKCGGGAMSSVFRSKRGRFLAALS
jgi:hypothetical protein